VIGTLHLLGRQGVSVIVAAGLDMAIWDALAKAAGLPLAELLGGSVGKVRTYNTNGLWLLPLDKLAKEAAELVEEGNFGAIKIRLGRPKLVDDLKALELVREAIGKDIQLMCDFNQGQTLQEAIWRCHALDDQGQPFQGVPGRRGRRALPPALGVDLHRSPLRLGRLAGEVASIGASPRPAVAAPRV
jgi:L-alanine-DL-glutamate epimerase-like enolase superfamily enzyme